MVSKLLLMLIVAGFEGSLLFTFLAVAMELRTAAFENGGAMPPEYTCEGKDVSPPLQWSGVTSGTAAFALVVDDPDAPRGTWVHWVLYDLPARQRELAEGAGNRPGPGVTGTNDFGQQRYGGPCPPSGAVHRYFFRLYALDERTGLKPGASKRDLIKAMEGHILGQAAIFGTFKR